jgi:hypothetical protein
MAGGVDVNIAADTREFDRAVRSGMVDPVEDAQKALDDFAAAGDEAGSSLAGTFRTQQQQTGELRRDIDELNRSIRDGSSSTKRVQVANVDEFRHRSTEAFDEAKDSARQNAIETAASFNGSFDSIAGGLQGLTSEFAVGFGPAGIIAGLVLASGIGLITSQIDSGTEAAQAQQQAVADLASQWIEAGKAGSSSADDIKARIEAMATSDGSDVVVTLQKAWELSKSAGADYQQVVEAIASASPRQIAAAQAAVDRLRIAHDEAASAARNDGTDSYSSAIHSAVGANKLADTLDVVEKQAKQAARAQELAAKAGLSDLALKQGLLKQVESAYDDAAGGVDSYIKGEHKVLDVKAYLSAMDKRTHSLEQYHDAMAQANLSPAAVKFLESQGADTAAAMLRGYEKASPAQQKRLQSIWTTAGNDNADNYQDAINAKLKGKKFDPPKIGVPVVPAPNDSALTSYLRQPAVKRIVIEGVTRSGTRLF